MRARNGRTAGSLLLTAAGSYLITSIILALVYGLAAQMTWAQAPLKVGIIGDQTLSSDIQKSYQVLARGVEILSKQGVAGVLHTGDLVESSVSPQEYRAQFEQATKLMDRVGKPWHLAPGDHDVNPPQYMPNSADRSREQMFHELYSRRVPGLTKRLNHSFNMGGYHFIALNSQEHLWTDPRWGNVFSNRLSEEQVAWLEKDLQAHRKTKGVVVFIHQPMWYNWGGWMRVHQTLRRYPVLAVIAGHFHYDQDEGEIDGIRYMVVGATGASVKQASVDAGNAHHVTVMTLQGRKVAFRLIPIEGAGTLQASPRTDMDRVQALDSMLGELFSFARQNQVCLRKGQLFGPNMGPARLSLVPIGNPIDLPLKVSIQLIGNNTRLKGPQFAKDACPQVTGEGVCILPPGARVESSNTSSVVLNNRFEPLPALWETGLEVDPGSKISAGDSIRLKVRLSFRGAQGELFVEKIVETKVTACST